MSFQSMVMPVPDYGKYRALLSWRQYSCGLAAEILLQNAQSRLRRGKLLAVIDDRAAKPASSMVPVWDIGSRRSKHHADQVGRAFYTPVSYDIPAMTRRLGKQDD